MIPVVVPPKYPILALRRRYAIVVDEEIMYCSSMMLMIRRDMLCFRQNQLKGISCE
jgi:hypothetical protein